MTCHHSTLELLPETKGKLRCRQCHLTLDREELADGYCPECFQTSGEKRYEFEAIEPADRGVARYRCEDCGAIVTSS